MRRLWLPLAGMGRRAVSALRLRLPMTMDLARVELERDVLRSNLCDHWAALRMIREAVETLGPVGCIASEEHVACAVAPTPQAEAAAIIAAIQLITGQLP